MKRIIAAVAGMVLTLSACKEKPPVINYSTATAKDTTYVSTVPAAQARNVLVEEYTGGACANCPAAKVLLKEMEKQNPGRVHVLALHIEGPIQGRPYHDAAYDFRHKDGTTIATSIYGGVTNLPSAGIDRTPYDGLMKIDRGVWSAAIQSGLSKPDSINLTLESSYDSATQEITVVATIAYPMTIDFDHNLNLMVVQDSITDVQEYPFNDPDHPGKNEEYEFEGVLRSVITPMPLGDPILAAQKIKEPGRVVVRVYTFDTKKINERAVSLLGTDKLYAPFKPEHSRIIGFINYASVGSYRVMQTAEAKTKK